MTVSFVCTGNICRSVLGEYILKTKCPELKVNSFGVGRTCGGKSSPKFIIEALEDAGIDCKNHRSTKLNPEILKSDLVIYFVNSHRQILEDFGCKNVRFIRDFCSNIPESCQKGVSIPDPYFNPSVTGDVCFLIENSIPGILKSLGL